MSHTLKLFRDPVSGLTHLLGAALGVAGLVFLVLHTEARESRVFMAVAVYGVSMVLLYASSAAYHLLNVAPERRARLRQLDHAMVPVFIAGTYTPFCLIALNGWIGDAVLIAVWGLALGGLLKSLFWIHSPRWITAGLFVLMGWLIVVAAVPLAKAVTPETFVYILSGGVAYTLGAAIYAKKWPDPWPPSFGFHEIWHLFVMAGSTLHFLAILRLVA